MTKDPSDKLALFRQQAAIIARKKEAAAETLRELREEIAKSDMELEEKSSVLKEQDGGEVLKGDEVRLFCEYHQYRRFFLDRKFACSAGA